jgi:hypothetical protein
MSRKPWMLVSISFGPRAERAEDIPDRTLSLFVFIHLIFSVPTSILIPEVVALCEGKKSSLNGQPIYVVAAGGIYNGKSLAASLM